MSRQDYEELLDEAINADEFSFDDMPEEMANRLAWAKFCTLTTKQRSDVFFDLDLDSYLNALTEGKQANAQEILVEKLANFFSNALFCDWPSIQDDLNETRGYTAAA